MFTSSGETHEFRYSLKDFDEFFQEVESLTEDAFIDSIHDFYSKHTNYNKSFEVVNLDKCSYSDHGAHDSIKVRVKIHKLQLDIVFPYIELPKYDSGIESDDPEDMNFHQNLIKIDLIKFTDFYSQIISKNVPEYVDSYLPKIDYRKKLGAMYFPY